MYEHTTAILFRLGPDCGGRASLEPGTAPAARGAETVSGEHRWGRHIGPGHSKMRRLPPAPCSAFLSLRTP